MVVAVSGAGGLPFTHMLFLAYLVVERLRNEDEPLDAEEDLQQCRCARNPARTAPCPEQRQAHLAILVQVRVEAVRRGRVEEYARRLVWKGLRKLQIEHKERVGVRRAFGP